MYCAVMGPRHCLAARIYDQARRNTGFMAELLDKVAYTEKHCWLKETDLLRIRIQLTHGYGYEWLQLTSVMNREGRHLFSRDLLK